MKIRVVLALAATLFPAGVTAQEVSTAVPTNRFSVGAYAGAYLDRTYVGAIDDRVAPLGGLRVGYALGSRMRLLADVGFTDLDGVARVGDADSYVVWGAKQWLTTGGVEIDLLPGRTGVSAGLELGAIFSEETIEREVGTSVREDFYPSGDSRGSALAVPSIALRHALTTHVDLKLSLRDYVVVDSTPWTQNLALTLGVSLQ